MFQLRFTNKDQRYEILENRVKSLIRLNYDYISIWTSICQSLVVGGCLTRNTITVVFFKRKIFSKYSLCFKSVSHIHSTAVENLKLVELFLCQIILRHNAYCFLLFPPLSLTIFILKDNKISHQLIPCIGSTPVLAD